MLIDWARKTPSLGRHLSGFVAAQLQQINRYKATRPANQDRTGKAAASDDTRGRAEILQDPRPGRSNWP